MDWYEAETFTESGHFFKAFNGPVKDASMPVWVTLMEKEHNTPSMTLCVFTTWGQ